MLVDVIVMQILTLLCLCSCVVREPFSLVYWTRLSLAWGRISLIVVTTTENLLACWPEHESL